MEKEDIFNEIFSAFRKAQFEGEITPLLEAQIERHWRISCRKFGLDPEDKDLLLEYLNYCIGRLRRLVHGTL